MLLILLAKMNHIYLSKKIKPTSRAKP